MMMRRRRMCMGTIPRTRMRIRQWVHTSAVREGSMRGGEVRPTSGRSKCWLCQSGTNTDWWSIMLGVHTDTQMGNCTHHCF